MQEKKLIFENEFLKIFSIRSSGFLQNQSDSYLFATRDEVKKINDIGLYLKNLDKNCSITQNKVRDRHFLINVHCSFGSNDSMEK